MESFNSFDYIAVSKGSIDFWDINLSLCVSRTYMYVLAVPCAQPLHIHYVLSLFHQQPLELSLGNEGRIYTSKIVNFSNYKKYTSNQNDIWKSNPKITVAIFKKEPKIDSINFLKNCYTKICSYSLMFHQRKNVEYTRDKKMK